MRLLSFSAPMTRAVVRLPVLMKWRATCRAYKKPEQAAEMSKQTAFRAPSFFCTKQAVEGKNMSGVTVATMMSLISSGVTPAASMARRAASVARSLVA
jgi:hypothetical protein